MIKLIKISQFFLREIPIHIINLGTALMPNHIVTNRIRGALMAPFFGESGKRLQIGKGVIINNPGSIFFGDDCYIAHYCYIQAKGSISFGNKVIIGPMSVLATSNHSYENGKVTNKGISKPIKIGSGTWCGGHVIITSGVLIGEGVIVGASSVVTKDIPENVKVVGIPAKTISNLEEVK